MTVTPRTPVDTPNVIRVPFVIYENISTVKPVPVGKDGLPSELGMIMKWN